MIRDRLFGIRSRLLALLRWPTRGVKVMVFDPDGRLLLVRNSCGRSDLFVLPGGGIGWRETPIDAAVREVAEEVGCRLIDLAPVGVHRANAEGKRDTVHLFRGSTRDAIHIDPREIAEARFVALSDLPASTSPATRRRIDEVCHGHPVTERW